MNREPGPSRRGFTLVEAIAALTIIATLGSIASIVIARGAAAYRTSATLGQVQGELAAAMDRVEREVRAIPHKSGTTAADISGITASSLTWNTSAGACSISLSGGQLLIATGGGPGRAILGDVSVLSVQCFNESGGAMAATLSGAACEPVRRIVISASVSRYGVTATLRTGIYLRSTMTGTQ